MAYWYHYPPFFLHPLSLFITSLTPSYSALPPSLLHYPTLQLKALLYFDDALKGLGVTLDPWIGPLWATSILHYFKGCEVAPYATTPPPPPRDPSTPWAGQYPWYPRPDMNLVDYCAHIFGLLVHDMDTTDGMIAAYHLNYPIIVVELKVIAAGGMIKLLERL